MVLEFLEVQLPSGFKLAYYEELPSTQDAAIERVRSGDRSTMAVITEFQTAGRGRSGSPWLAPAGSSLLASYILRSARLHQEDMPKLSFVAAVAAAEAIELVARVEIGIKWPNDLLIGGCKVAGLLIETVSDPLGAPVAIVGIGVNVTNMSFPSELVMEATALKLESAQRFEITDLEAAIRTELYERFRELLRIGFAPALRGWRARDCTSGMRFQTIVRGRSVEGIAQGVSDTGGLQLELEDGQTVEVVAATSIKPE